MSWGSQGSNMQHNLGQTWYLQTIIAIPLPYRCVLVQAWSQGPKLKHPLGFHRISSLFGVFNFFEGSIWLAVICGPGCLGLNLLVSQAAQTLNTDTYLSLFLAWLLLLCWNCCEAIWWTWTIFLWNWFLFRIVHPVLFFSVRFGICSQILRLGLYVVEKHIPHVLLPVVLAGLMVIFTGSAFFLPIICERILGYGFWVAYTLFSINSIKASICGTTSPRPLFSSIPSTFEKWAAYACARYKPYFPQVMSSFFSSSECCKTHSQAILKGSYGLSLSYSRLMRYFANRPSLEPEGSAIGSFLIRPLSFSKSWFSWSLGIACLTW